MKKTKQQNGASFFNIQAFLKMQTYGTAALLLTNSCSPHRQYSKYSKVYLTFFVSFSF